MLNLFNNNTYNQDNQKPTQNREEQRNMSGNVDFETLQKTRQDLIGEIQAIIEYDNHIHSANNNMAKKTWVDIKSEELVHVGELLALAKYLDPSQAKFVEMGIKEFEERLNGKNS